MPIVEGARDFWRKNPDGSLRCDVFTGLVTHIESQLASAGVELDVRPRVPRGARPANDVLISGQVPS
jgi:hypothetical protein